MSEQHLTIIRMLDDKDRRIFKLSKVIYSQAENLLYMITL